MNVICVDDEPLAVEYTLSQCSLLPGIDEAKGFTEAQSALDWLSDHSADLAILDIANGTFAECYDIAVIYLWLHRVAGDVAP